MRRAWLCLLLAGCAPVIPEGTYACDANADCPPGMFCQGGLCYRDVDAGPCVPRDCATLRANCGALDDGCGTEIDCGACPDGQACGSGGIPNLCGCQPRSCDALGVECGQADSGCGAMVDCGDCGGAGTCVAGTCTCEATNPCNPLGYDCGQALDGCGGMVSCGDCVLPETCGGEGETNRCGVGTCIPDDEECAERECGMAPDGCGGFVDCGTCASPEICVAGRGTCECSPGTCGSLAYECGAPDDGCGAPLDCGACPPGQGCSAAYACACVTDPYEGNDTHPTASARGSLASGSMVSVADATMHSAGDQDWFRWTIPAAAAGEHQFRIDLRGIPAGADYALEAYALCPTTNADFTSESCREGTPVTAAPPLGRGCLSNRSGASDERLVMRLSCSVTELVVRVRQITSGMCTPYDLSLEYGFMAKGS